jgi:ABC-type glutathione transport system ATPase component
VEKNMQTNIKDSIHTKLHNLLRRKTINIVWVTHFPTASQSLADEYALGLFCSGSAEELVPVPDADPELVAASPSEPDSAVKGMEKRRGERWGVEGKRRKERREGIKEGNKTSVTRKKKENK